LIIQIYLSSSAIQGEKNYDIKQWKLRERRKCLQPVPDIGQSIEETMKEEMVSVL
jgi:hypothetical protein